jgi:hypothetical protein
MERGSRGPRHRMPRSGLSPSRTCSSTHASTANTPGRGFVVSAIQTVVGVFKYRTGLHGARATIDYPALERAGIEPHGLGRKNDISSMTVLFLSLNNSSQKSAEQICASNDAMLLCPD